MSSICTVLLGEKSSRWVPLDSLLPPGNFSATKLSSSHTQLVSPCCWPASGGRILAGLQDATPPPTSSMPSHRMWPFKQNTVSQAQDEFICDKHSNLQYALPQSQLRQHLLQGREGLFTVLRTYGQLSFLSGSPACLVMVTDAPVSMVMWLASPLPSPQQ
jgi:hypothetical protein